MRNLCYILLLFLFSLQLTKDAVRVSVSMRYAAKRLNASDLTISVLVLIELRSAPADLSFLCRWAEEMNNAPVLRRTSDALQ